MATSNRIPLSTREEQVLGLIGRGLSTKEIAARLQLSYHTISDYRKQLCRKLNIHTSIGLAIYAATLFGKEILENIPPF